MPQCIKCPTKQSKLNVGDLCKSCFKNEKDSKVSDDTTNLTNIAGVSVSAIEAMPDLSPNDLNKPLTTGAMLKIISGAIKPIHDRIAVLERRIDRIEESQRKTTETVSKIESVSKDAEKSVTTTETMIKILEEKHEKLKKFVIKQQSQISNQEKNTRLRNVVIGGLDETQPLSVNEHTASSDDEKVKLIMHTLNLSNIDFVRCRRVGIQDQSQLNYPRFLVVEFSNHSDRNIVKARGSQLQSIAELNGIRIKADLTKVERMEYKRLYDFRDRLSRENPRKIAIVDKGVLKLDGQEVDRYKTPCLVI